MHLRLRASLVAQWKRIGVPMQEMLCYPWSGKKTPGGGNCNLLQYSCLGNPMDRGAWRPTVHGAATSQITLSNWTTAITTLDLKLLKVAYVFNSNNKKILNEMLQFFKRLAFKFICMREIWNVIWWQRCGAIFLPSQKPAQDLAVNR